MKNWTISVGGGLSAHFKGADWECRAGMDWNVTLERDGETKMVMVRSYQDETRDAAPEQVASQIARFIKGKLDEGWDPDQYGWEPGELTLPPSHG